jgi:hypothetical protein
MRFVKVGLKSYLSSANINSRSVEVKLQIYQYSNFTKLFSVGDY